MQNENATGVKDWKPRNTSGIPQKKTGKNGGGTQGTILSVERGGQGQNERVALTKRRKGGGWGSEGSQGLTKHKAKETKQSRGNQKRLFPCKVGVTNKQGGTEDVTAD